MKILRIAAITIILIGLCIPVMACGSHQSLPSVTFNDAIGNTSNVSRAIFTDGEVLFKQDQSDIYVSGVTGFPVVTDSNGNISDDQIIGVRMSKSDYERVRVGDIISVNGQLYVATNNSSTVHYISGSINNIGGERSTNYVYQNDNSFLWMYFLFFVYPSMMSNSNYNSWSYYNSYSGEDTESNYNSYTDTGSEFTDEESNSGIDTGSNDIGGDSGDSDFGGGGDSGGGDYGGGGDFGGGGDW